MSTFNRYYGELATKSFNYHQIGTVMILNFRTDRFGQTVQTQIRLLLEEQSDPDVHCLLFQLRVFDKIPSSMVPSFEF